MRIIAFLAILFSPCVYSFDLMDVKDIPVEYQITSEKDLFAYSFAMNYCENKVGAFADVEKAALIEAATDTFQLNVKNYIRRAKNLGVGPYLVAILESKGYYHGVDECYGDDGMAKLKFTLNLLSAHSVGSLSGASTGALTWILPGKALKWVAVNVLRIPPTFLKRISQASWALMGAGAVAYVAHLKIKEVEMELEYIEGLESQNKEKTKRLEQVKSDLKSLMDMAGNPDLDPETEKEIREYIGKLSARMEKIELEIEENNKKVETI